MKFASFPTTSNDITTSTFHVNVFNDRLIFVAGNSAENSMVSRGANIRAAKTVLNGVNGQRNFRYYCTIVLARFAEHFC